MIHELMNFHFRLGILGYLPNIYPIFTQYLPIFSQSFPYHWAMEIPQSSVVEPPFSQVKMAVCHVIMPRCNGSQSGGADAADGEGTLWLCQNSYQK